MTGEAIYFLFSYLISFYFKKVFGKIIDICHYCNFTGNSHDSLGASLTGSNFPAGLKADSSLSLSSVMPN